MQQTVTEQTKMNLSTNKRQNKKKAGLELKKHFTRDLENPLDVECEIRSSKITNPDGSIVFSMDGIEVPTSWSQLATDIVISKYIRKAGVPKTSNETSVRQLVYRVAHTIREMGETLGGYFHSHETADIFEDELSYMLIHQMGAFNSPVWFNCGLYHQYGITGKSDHYFYNSKTDQIEYTNSAYEYPQCSACFIQSVSDDLMDIYSLVKQEAKVFKYGSGSGTNFSKIRGKQEKLSGGGYSSGLMSFLEVFDRAAGATKSGGTTRRAAKMVCLDIDHPEIVDFIHWKSKEELKAKALIQQGYESNFNGEAYRTVSGQNSNNSVRITDEFMKAYENNTDWNTTHRTNGEVCETFKTRELMGMISQAAWECADPGLQFDTTINKWHTCSNTDKIYSSNPCSEYMFLNDSACNLASLNLTKFMREDGSFDVEDYKHACRIFILAQEILVDGSSYPTEKIAKTSHDYRPLGLGYANLGTLLMMNGIPYNSEKGRATAAAITAITCGEAYAMSSEIAQTKGPFNGYFKNAEPMLNVMQMHKDAAYQIPSDFCPPELYQAACESWEHALESGQKWGYRNAQTTVLAPTGTIGLLMDCDTTGIEPEFALVKYKKLAGGGYFKIVNQSVSLALQSLGYSDSQVLAIKNYVLGYGSLNNPSSINRETLISKGLQPADLEKIEQALSQAMNLSHAFSVQNLTETTKAQLNIPETMSNGNLLPFLGFSPNEIDDAEKIICGTSCIEGAPYLKDEHLAVFDCANRCGAHGTRFIEPMGHVKMMAATQPFISGAISKTVNLPHEVTPQEIENIYYQSWKLGLKSIALYRDGSKGSQPLNSQADKEEKLSSENLNEIIEQQKEEIEELLAKHEAEIAHTKERYEEQIRNLEAQLAKVQNRERLRLSQKRNGFTVEAKLAGHKVYLRTGEYPDGRLGEIFIDMHKEGAAFRSMMNCFAIAVSLGLQHGVPLEEFVNVFTFTRFEPQGTVDHPNVKFATSIVDYIFRVLGMEYLGRTDFVQVKPINGHAAQIENRIKSIKGENVISSQQKPAECDENFQPSHATEEQYSQPMASSEKTENSGVNQYLKGMMGDAPFCDDCGHITVRNGSCYRCLNCGNSMGCS